MFLPDPTQTRSWKKIAAWIAGGLLLLAAGWSARPLYHALKVRQAERILAKAEQLSKQHQWSEAVEKAEAALHLNPQSIGAIRLMAQALTRLQSPDAFPYWSALLNSHTAVESDFLEAAHLALDLRRLDAAGVYLTEGLKRMPFSNEVLRSAVRYCELKGDSLSAIKLARTLLARLPSDLEARLILGRHLLALRQPDASREGKALLWQTAQSNLPGAEAALVLLAYLPDLTKSEAEECRRKLASFPTRKIDLELVAFDLDIRLKPQKRAEIIDAALAKYRQGNPAELLSLTRWLNDKRAFKKVTETLPLPVVQHSRDLFLVYLDAQAALGRWTELERLLALPKSPLEPALVAVYQARVAQELKKDRQAEQHWAQAQWLAGENPALLSYLAEYAEKVGATAEAAKAYRRLTKTTHTAGAAYLALIRLAEPKADTRELRDLLKEVSRVFPNDPAPRNDLAYLELLRQENIPAATAVARALLAERPQLLAHRTTLALAYLRLNDPQSAKALYRDLKLDWNQVLPGWRAVYAAVLAASGDLKGARQLARSLSRQPLKPEERALVQPWL